VRCQGRPAEKVTFKLRHRCQEGTSHVKMGIKTHQVAEKMETVQGVTPEVVALELASDQPG